MSTNIRPLLFAGIAIAGSAMFQSAAQAADYSNSANYNNPIGMSATQENSSVDSSLRDANGNLTVVNGQITSSSFSHVSGVQTASSSTTGVGSGNTSIGGTATAIGNSLNVITAGSNNIVIVSSTQTNNGNQNASTKIGGQ